MRGFCEKKFGSMLVSGTFTKAVGYLMLLSDSIIAGYFIGEAGVAGINAIAPITAIVTFFGDLLSTGVGIAFAREMGAMRKDRADEIYGQGLVISIGIGLLSAIFIHFFQSTYFAASGITGDILEQALRYYRLAPINAFLTIVIFYLEQMVYSDGDELINNICYGFQIGGNIICSIILTSFMGMTGIVLGSIIGNGLGILTCLLHYLRKECTLHFVWHLSLADFLYTARYSIVDSSVYICWGIMDFVMIGFISTRFGDAGLITLAIIVSLMEFGVVLDGVGMAMQPLLGTYYGEQNHVLIKRVMRSAVKAAIVEGLVATALIWIFARPFCGLFGVTGGEALEPSVTAVRIVALGLTFTSLVSLTTSYYMLIDHIGMATFFACLQNGILYMALPMLGATLIGFNGLWVGAALSPVLTLAFAYAFVYLRFGRENFPFLLKHMDTEIMVLDDELTQEAAVEFPERIGSSLLDHGYPREVANRAALFVEEIIMTLLEMNGQTKKPLLVEFSVFFDADSALIIERDSGTLLDLTDPDFQIRGLSSFVLSGLMEAKQEKAYLVTTGYNRTMLRFPKEGLQRG